MIITAYGDNYICSRAIRGDNYIRLLDDNGNVVVEFSGVSDFSGYSVCNGEFESPSATNEERIAAIEQLVKGTPSYGELLEAVNILLGETS